MIPQDGSWSAGEWFYPISSKLMPISPINHLHPSSQAGWTRSPGSLKHVFYAWLQISSAWHQAPTHYILTLMTLGWAGTNALCSLITHYVHQCLARKKVGDGFVATLGRDAERTPSAVSYFSPHSPTHPFLSVINQFSNQEAKFSCSLFLWLPPRGKGWGHGRAAARSKCCFWSLEQHPGHSVGTLGSQPCSSSHPGASQGPTHYMLEERGFLNFLWKKKLCFHRRLWIHA